MYETRVKSNGKKLKLKVWNSNKGKILEEKVHNLKKVQYAKLQKETTQTLFRTF